MGGSAFPALDTPRMPLSVYQHALKTIHAKLLTLYAQVSTPIEASAKMDYGDVDVLVYQPLPGWKKIVGEKGVTAKVILTEEGEGKETSPTEDELAALLGAKAWKRDKDSEEIHFAIPWPKEFTYEGVVEATAPSPQETTTITTAVSQLSLSSPLDLLPSKQLRCIQIDLHICPTLHIYNWQLLRCAHGDFWSIVGSVIRRYGLSFRNDGLYVRMAEVEKVNRKGSLVLLSGDPGVVLGFLFGNRRGTGEEEGVKTKEEEEDEVEKEVHERYWRRDAFKNIEDMCDFIRSNCRFYCPNREDFVAAAEKGGDVDEEDSTKLEIGAGRQPQAEVQKKDRYGVHKRDAFRYWLLEYKPMHSAADREVGTMGEFAGISREEVANMVVEWFGIVEEFEKKKEVGLRMVGVGRLWGEVRRMVEGLLQEEKEKENAKEALVHSDVGGSGAEEAKVEGIGHGKSEPGPQGDDVGTREPKPSTSANLPPSATTTPPPSEPITTTRLLTASSTSATLPPLSPTFILRTLRRRLSIEPRALPLDELDDTQRAYRAGDFDEVKEWIERNWKQVAETKRRENAEKSAIHYREKCKRVGAERAAQAEMNVNAGDAETNAAAEAGAVAGGEMGVGARVNVGLTATEASDEKQAVCEQEE